MRVFVCSDIHMATDNLDQLLEKAGYPLDGVLFVGDLTNWGSAADAKSVLSRFKIKPVFAIPGNLDTHAVVDVLEGSTEYVHGRSAKLGDWMVVGFGGGSLNNPGEVLFSEEAITEGLEPLLKKTNAQKTILLTHQPPANTKLDRVGGHHPVGSQAVRQMSEKYQPAFQFCGHIHESWGEDKIGKTRCYNVAAVKEGRAGVLDLKKLMVTGVSC
ncbi:MAG: metallophosphoesterase [Deltaproteobacteria bacterium]|nr:metallophosphoesterase [Deltaproteobacteria bacterium]